MSPVMVLTQKSVMVVIPLTSKVDKGLRKGSVSYCVYVIFSTTELSPSDYPQFLFLSLLHVIHHLLPRLVSYLYIFSAPILEAQPASQQPLPKTSPICSVLHHSILPCMFDIQNWMTIKLGSNNVDDGNSQGTRPIPQVLEASMTTAGLKLEYKIN